MINCSGEMHLHRNGNAAMPRGANARPDGEQPESGALAAANEQPVVQQVNYILTGQKNIEYSKKYLMSIFQSPLCESTRTKHYCDPARIMNLFAQLKCHREAGADSRRTRTTVLVETRAAFG